MEWLRLVGSLKLQVSFKKEMYRETLRARATVISYGVATISGLLKIIGVFCERALKKRRYSAKETYNPKEPTHRSNPIPYLSHTCLLLRGVQIAD